MSSNNCVAVTKVKIKVLEIEEFCNGNPQPIVDVTLKKGDSVGVIDGVEVFQGKMKYDDGEKNQKIDMVEAIFSDDVGQSGEPGNIQLRVTLTNNNEFIDPPVTTVPSDPSTVPTHCVEIENDGENAIIVTFLEPQEGEFVAYPALYFHTTQGVVDPGMGVRRRPG